jgi:hypothetical protein
MGPCFRRNDEQKKRQPLAATSSSTRCSGESTRRSGEAPVAPAKHPSLRRSTRRSGEAPAAPATIALTKALIADESTRGPDESTRRRTKASVARRKYSSPTKAPRHPGESRGPFSAFDAFPRNATGVLRVGRQQTVPKKRCAASNPLAWGSQMSRRLPHARLRVFGRPFVEACRPSSMRSLPSPHSSHTRQYGAQ